MNTSSRLRFGRLLTLGALWGSSYLFIDLALRSIPATGVAFGRQLLAGLVLLPVVAGPWLRGDFKGLRRRLILLAVVMVGAPSLLVALGQRYVSASVAAILVATSPLLAAAIARHLDKLRWSAERTGGLILGLLGVGLLFGVDLRGSSDELLGASLVLLASLGYAVGGFVVASTFNEIRPLALTGATSLVSSVLLAPGLLASPVNSSSVSVSSALALLILGVGGTACGWWLYYSLINADGPEVASLAQYLAPAFAVIFGASLLGDRLTVARILGLLAILGGSWLASRGPTVTST